MDNVEVRITVNEREFDAYVQESIRLGFSPPTNYKERKEAIQNVLRVWHIDFMRKTREGDMT